LNGSASHISRLLGNNQVDHAVIEIIYSLLRCIKIRDLDLPLFVSILDGLGCSALSPTLLSAEIEKDLIAEREKEVKISI